MGHVQWKRFAVERIPIPKITAKERHPFIDLVDRILAGKDADPNEDTHDMEDGIDRMVYQLYGLTP